MCYKYVVPHLLGRVHVQNVNNNSIRDCCPDHSLDLLFSLLPFPPLLQLIGAEPARAERAAIAAIVLNGSISLPSTIPMHPARRSWFSTACFHAAKLALCLNFGIAESE